MTVGLTLPILGASVAAIKMSNDFNQSLDRIVGLVGVSRQQVNAWKDDILDLSRATAVGPKELANALFFVTSAGFKGAEAMAVLDASARAAAAGLGETVVIADAVTSAVNAYGADVLSAAAATDVLIAAVREGKLEPASLAAVLGRLLPTAAALGIAFDDVAGVMAVMSRTGLDAAEASTSLNAIMSTLLKPSATATKLLKELGLEMADLRKIASEDDGVVKVMRLLDAAFGDNDEALAQIVPNVRAFRGIMNVLAQDAAIVDEVMDGVTNSVGDTNKAFAAAAEGDAFKFKQAITDIGVELTRLGNILAPIIGETLLPLLRDGVGIVGDLTTEFRKLSPDVQKAAVALGLALAAAGPLLTITGLMLSPLAALARAMLAVAAASGVMGTSMQKSSASAVLLTRAAGALAVAFGAAFALQKGAEALGIGGNKFDSSGLSIDSFRGRDREGIEALLRERGGHPAAVSEAAQKIEERLRQEEALARQSEETAASLAKQIDASVGAQEGVEGLTTDLDGLLGGLTPVGAEVDKVKTVLDQLVEAFKKGEAATRSYVQQLGNEARAKLSAAQGALGADTQEIAQLRAQLAEIDRDLLNEQRFIATWGEEVGRFRREELEARRANLQFELDRRQADFNVQTTRIQAQNPALLTDRERQQALEEFGKLVIESGKTFRDLVAAGEPLVPELAEAKQAVADFRLGVDFLTNDAFRNGLIPATAEATTSVASFQGAVETATEAVGTATERLLTGSEEWIQALQAMAESALMTQARSAALHAAGAEAIDPFGTLRGRRHAGGPIARGGLYELLPGESVNAPGQGGGFSATFGDIHIHGIQDPEGIADAIINSVESKLHARHNRMLQAVGAV